MTLSVEREFVDGAWRTVVRDEGSSSAVGPFTVNHDDPGFLNPETGNGIATVPVPANAIVQAFAVATIAFSQVTVDDEIDLVFATEQEQQPNRFCVAYAPPTAVTPGQEIGPKATPTRVVTEAPGFVWAALFAQAEITAGQIAVYAIVTPLS